MARTKVVVIGAGPAGLAAATRLLEGAQGQVEVSLLHMGHHLGGKACSHRFASGAFREHGWHMVLGFYDRFRALLRRAGINERETLVSMGGTSHPYESWSQRIHTLPRALTGPEFSARFLLDYDGIPALDRENYSEFFAGAYLLALSAKDLTRYDDVCFDTFAVQEGLLPHQTAHSLFRVIREGYFNYPEQISAYHQLQTMRLMSSPERAEAFVARGPWSELVWDPIGQYFDRLGGQRFPYTLITDWIYEGRRIVGLRAAMPNPEGHQYGAAAWGPGEVPRLEGTSRTIEGFDYVISTIPQPVLVGMNAHDEKMWSSPYFARLLNLRSAVTISMTVTLRGKAMPFLGPVFGFPAPLGIGINMTPFWREYQQRPDVGSILSFVGQEAGFEEWTDQQIIDYTLDNFSRSAQVGDLRRAGILEVEMHRNRADHERLMLGEPGVQQFRPGPLTPFDNLFFAGDWVRNEVDVICMEGAIASGLAAAELVLQRARAA